MKKIIILCTFLLLSHNTFCAQSKLLGLTSRGDAAGILALLEREPLTNVTETVPPHLDNGGYNALHFLAAYPIDNVRNAIQALITAGTSPTARNKAGQTPENLATDPGIKQALKSLA